MELADVVAHMRSEQEAGETEDEIVAALLRQLDVVEGTLVMLTNVTTMLSLQLRNLRAEVALLGIPAPGAAPAAGPKPEKTPNGALPAEPTEDCDHTEALIIDTRDGVQRVCPHCDA